MDVDVVVVSYNTRELLRLCLQSIALSDSAHAILVDNASADGSPAMVRDEFPGATLIALDQNIGFGPANNHGAAAGGAPYILFLNSDAQLTPGALKLMVQFLESHAGCCAVGPKLVYEDGGYQPSCRHFPTVLRNAWNTAGLHDRFSGRFLSLRNWLEESEYQSGMRVDMISGACILMRRAYFERVGGFDENLFMYEEEMDIFLPAHQLGAWVGWCGEAVVIHAHGASSGERKENAKALAQQYRSKYYCFRKHYGANAARLAYWSDRFLWGFSALRNKVRGRETPAGLHFRLAKESYRSL